MLDKLHNNFFITLDCYQYFFHSCLYNASQYVNKSVNKWPNKCHLFLFFLSLHTHTRHTEALRTLIKFLQFRIKLFFIVFQIPNTKRIDQGCCYCNMAFLVGVYERENNIFQNCCAIISCGKKVSAVTAFLYHSCITKRKLIEP